MTILQLQSIRRLLLSILAIVEDELVMRGALQCRTAERRNALQR